MNCIDYDTKQGKFIHPVWGWRSKSSRKIPAHAQEFA